MKREIELGSHVLEIEQDMNLENDAGVVIWDAALVLIHYLAHAERQDGGSILKGKRVVDVGSGTGVVGISAAMLGAKEVVLTDLKHLLPLIDTNIKANGVEGQATAVALDWTEGPGAAGPPFDVVLASDVMYQMEHLDDLLSTLAGLVATGGTIFIADELREGSFGWHRQLRKHGLVGRLVPESEQDPDWHSDDIHIYQVHKLPSG